MVVLDAKGIGYVSCCVDSQCNAATCMNLPEGKTCGDCFHIRRCRMFGFTSSEKNKHCDFFPRRFKDIVELQCANEGCEAFRTAGTSFCDDCYEEKKHGGNTG